MVDNDGVLLRAFRNLNSKWLGYRFVVFSLPSTVSIYTAVQQATLPTAGITEIEFPSMDVEMLRVPSLSTINRHIPRRISYGDLVLRAPTIRQTSLWDRIELQLMSIKDPSVYPSVTENIVIGEYEVSGTHMDLLPIAIWSVRGAQAKSFKPASANAQGTGSMPLEELRMQVDSIVRL